MSFNSDLRISFIEMDRRDNAFSELQRMNQTFECQGPCSYNVAVAITQNNCKTIQGELILVNVTQNNCITSVLDPHEITLYPNPSSNLVYIIKSSSKGGKDRVIGL